MSSREHTEYQQGELFSPEYQYQHKIYQLSAKSVRVLVVSELLTVQYLLPPPIRISSSYLRCWQNGTPITSVPSPPLGQLSQILALGYAPGISSFMKLFPSSRNVPPVDPTHHPTHTHMRLFFPLKYLSHPLLSNLRSLAPPPARARTEHSLEISLRSRRTSCVLQNWRAGETNRRSKTYTRPKIRLTPEQSCLPPVQLCTTGARAARRSRRGR